MKNDEVQKRTDLALEAFANKFIKKGEYSDALLLLKLLVERGPDKAKAIADMIDCAVKGKMQSECINLLAAIAHENPDVYTINSMLAGFLATEKRIPESRTFAGIAARIRPLSPPVARKPKMHILVLQSIAAGGYHYSYKRRICSIAGVNELHTLLDPENISFSRLLVDDLDSVFRILDDLSEYDVIYNSISDPSLYEAALYHAAVICDRLDIPVVNDPRRVLDLKRELFYQKFSSCDEIIAPASVYLPAEKSSAAGISERIKSDASLTPPVIVRAAGFQGGRFMRLVDDADEDIDIYKENGVHIIKYADVGFTDERAPGMTFYPKYRAIFVNGKLFPAHAFSADYFNVHKWNSIPVMEKYPWLNDREIAYLENPAACFHEGRWEHLEKSLSTLGLDYVGVDFAPSAQEEDLGKLVIFECNPSMRNRLTQLPEGDRVQQQWKKIVTEAHYCLCERAGIAPWDFNIRRGLK